MQIDCYTDASYIKVISKSVVAYKIGLEPINVIVLNCNNTEAEIHGVQHCVNLCISLYNNIQIINIHTDCQKALKYNFDVPNNMTLNILKLKGHKKKDLRDENDVIFHTVDRKARKYLRELISQKVEL